MTSVPENVILNFSIRFLKAVLVVFLVTILVILICFTNTIFFQEDFLEITTPAPIEILTVDTMPEASTTASSRSHLSSTTVPAPRNQGYNIFPQNSSDCPFEEWNQIRTESIPNTELHKKWLEKWKSSFKYLYHKLPSVFAAFVHEEQIIVTLTSENQVNKTVYCRYFDCRRREIMDPFKSFIFTTGTVFCARRPGAKFITVSKTLNETLEYSVPIVPRLEKPPHCFTVCMATLYGNEPKFLQIVDFIEYHKLQGATFFHVYVKNVSNYDRALLDNYVKTGEIEIITLNDHFWRADYMWHNGQINDCHHRSKFFSKWTAFIDIDERLEMNNNKFTRVADYLDTIQDSIIANLHFRVKWVMKHKYTPERYKTEAQLKKEMLFHKYQNTSQIGAMWDQPKCIIRPENVGIMSIHGPREMYEGEQITLVPEDTGFIRHYRNVEQKIFRGALKIMMSHAPFNFSSIDGGVKKLLTNNIIKRVKWVYDIKQPTCQEKVKMINIESKVVPCDNSTLRMA